LSRNKITFGLSSYFRYMVARFEPLSRFKIVQFDDLLVICEAIHNHSSEAPSCFATRNNGHSLWKHCQLLTLSTLHLERTSLYTVEKHNNE
ncbi:hypothetical protein, partial [Vibrio parahaemolyticus]|uniref:hypothetical protein n=1 Tax=Vibrio parahaemolyticus TaxID=670 RepID=UPI001C60E392